MYLATQGVVRAEDKLSTAIDRVQSVVVTVSRGSTSLFFPHSWLFVLSFFCPKKSLHCNYVSRYSALGQAR